jgi:hypothetical protein
MLATPTPSIDTAIRTARQWPQQARASIASYHAIGHALDALIDVSDSNVAVARAKLNEARRLRVRDMERVRDGAIMRASAAMCGADQATVDRSVPTVGAAIAEALQ